MLLHIASRRAIAPVFNQSCTPITFTRTQASAAKISKIISTEVELSAAEQAAMAVQRRKERVLIPLVFRGNLQRNLRKTKKKYLKY